MRYKCVCSYDGRAYCGWQRQGVEENSVFFKRSIQSVLEESISKLYRENIQIQGSSRTDAGVHALAQVFHFDTKIEIPIKNIIKALNKLLPSDIMINYMELVEDDFHCRYDVIEKTYRYVVNTGVKNVFSVHYEYQYGRALELSRLEQMIPLFLGKKDYKALMASGSDKTSSIREIKSLKICSEGDKVIFEITADGFLYHMVRIIVGAFLTYNEGKYSIHDFERALLEKNRKVFSKIVPACGLYLCDIKY